MANDITPINFAFVPRMVTYDRGDVGTKSKPQFFRTIVRANAICIREVNTCSADADQTLDSKPSIEDPVVCSSRNMHNP